MAFRLQDRNPKSGDILRAGADRRATANSAKPRAAGRGAAEFLPALPPARRRPQTRPALENGGRSGLPRTARACRHLLAGGECLLEEPLVIDLDRAVPNDAAQLLIAQFLELWFDSNKRIASSTTRRGNCRSQLRSASSHRSFLGSSSAAQERHGCLVPVMPMRGTSPDADSTWRSFCRQVECHVATPRLSRWDDP
jgi:hypothetical protein